MQAFAASLPRLLQPYQTNQPFLSQVPAEAPPQRHQPQPPPSPLLRSRGTLESDQYHTIFFGEQTTAVKKNGKNVETVRQARSRPTSRSRSSLHTNGEPGLGRRHKCEKKLLSTYANYTGQLGKVRADTGDRRVLHITAGVRQACVLSPKLFTATLQ